jgi:chemotaxis protein histidine kinase CheA
MVDDLEFSQRMAQIRARFATKLSDRIDDMEATIVGLAEGQSGAVPAVAEAYRRFHEICGIGPTIGFAATADVARRLEALLIAPFRDGRGLSAGELAQFSADLAALRTAAQAETQSQT